MRPSFRQTSRGTSARPSNFLWSCCARKADNFLNSTFVNLPSIQKMERQHELEISRADAERRGIADGDRVRVFNQRGEIFLRARVDGELPAGVVGARLGWAKLSDHGVNINVLTSDRLTDLGGGATFYSTLVEVERVSRNFLRHARVRVAIRIDWRGGFGFRSRSIRTV